MAIDRSAVRRTPVLTLYPHRPAEVGVPGENPHLAERGMVITDFVDRVGDPVPIVAPDGSSHRAESLTVDALRSLLQTLGPIAEPVGVTHPAHWSPAAVDALRSALAARPEFAGRPPVPLISDAVASLTALQNDPGVPARGIIALCDVGGTGASITLADAGNGFQPVSPTVRHPDFSGGLIDQALLSRVVGELTAAGAVDLSGTSAIGSLGRLRAQCREAKERLSTAAVTSLPVDLPGRRTEVRITRPELDDVIREPLAGFLELLQETLQRNGIRPGDLVAVASVGGSARMPVLTTSLSEHLRVQVITPTQPELSAAIGAGLRAVRGLVPDGATAMAPAAARVVPVDPGAAGSSTFRALAWSDADDVPEPVAPDPAAFDHVDAEAYEPYAPRPQLAFTDPGAEFDETAAVVPWYRRPLGMVAVGAVVVLAVLGTAAWYVLKNDESSQPATNPAPATTTAPAESGVPQPGVEVPPQTETQAPQPGSQTPVEQAPPPAVTVTEEPPSAPEAPPSTTTDAPPPPVTTTEPPPVTVTETPPSSTVPSSTQQPIIPTLPYQTIPGLPFVPAPIQPAQP